MRMSRLAMLLSFALMPFLTSNADERGDGGDSPHGFTLPLDDQGSVVGMLFPGYLRHVLDASSSPATVNVYVDVDIDMDPLTPEFVLPDGYTAMSPDTLFPEPGILKFQGGESAREYLVRIFAADFGRVIQLDGEKGHIVLPDEFGVFDGKSPFTLETRVFFRRLPEADDWTRAPVPINLRGENELRLTTADGCSSPNRVGIRLQLEESGWSSLVESSPLDARRWHHFAVSFSPESGWVLYQDGVKVDENPNAEAIAPSDGGSFLGGDPNSGISKFVDGFMGETRIWNTVRNEEQVRELMDVPARGDEDGLIACWPLNHRTGQTALDISGNEHHGTLVDCEWTISSFRVLDASGNLCVAGIEALLPELSDTERKFALRVLGEIGSKAAVEVLDRYLEDSSAFVRAAACRAIAEAGGDRFVELMAKAIGDEDRRIGEYAADQLLISGTEGISVLAGILDNVSADAPTRIMIARKMGEHKAEESLNSLVSVFSEDNPELLVAAAESVGVIMSDSANERTIGALTPLLDNSNEQSAFAAATAIGRIGGDKALQVLSKSVFSDWPMWQYDAARSAATPLRLEEQLHLQWVREFPEPKRAWPFQWDDRGKLDFDVSYSPVVMGERIFVPSNVTDSVSAYHIDDGRKLWRFYADGPVRLAPAAWRDKLYFVSDDGYIYCLNAANGELNWKFHGAPGDGRLLGNERIISFWPARGGPVVKEGSVYFGAGIWPLHGVFCFALDAERGELEWVNDTISSYYTQLPHSRATGFGAFVPQGYIAASQEQLVFAGGRTPPAFLNRHTGELEEVSWRAKPDGGYAVNVEGLGKLANEMIDNRVHALRGEIDGEIFSSIVARDRLFVATECGKLYCFGPEAADVIVHEYRPTPLSQPHNRWLDVAANLIGGVGETEGYALILGIGSGDLVRAMLHEGNMHTVVVDNDRRKVQALRDELVAAGMYGRRAAVIEADPALFSVQPYLFSIVASENSLDAGIGSDPDKLAFILDRLRPYRSFAYLGNVGVSENALQQALAGGSADQVSVRFMEDFVLARRSGPLAGAGQWTHQYHDAANTNSSREDRAELPLGILWFGGPNNHNILPRHAGGPRPQIAAGRQVFLGVETIAARCVYTGRALWEREFPGVGHSSTNLALEERWAEGQQVYMSNIPGATYIGSPFVTLPDSVYLRYEGNIHRLDPATGETLAVFSLPGRSVSEIYGNPNLPDWGHHRVVGDYLITTSEPHIFEDQELPRFREDDADHILGWIGSYSGTSSRRIAVMNRLTGEVHWQVEADVGFRHNAIVASDDTLFIIDGLSKNALEIFARRGNAPETPSRIHAVDLASGNKRWSTESDVFGTFLLYVDEHDVLIEGGSHDMRWQPDDEPVHIVARKGSDGTAIWERAERFHLPGAIRGDVLITGNPVRTPALKDGAAVSVITGEPVVREQPFIGESSVWTYNRRKGCGTLNASGNFLLFRSGYAAFFDLKHDSGTGFFSGFRSGCTANMIPADGLLSALDYTRTCTCSYALQTSLAMIHMPDDHNIEFWTTYGGAIPDPRGHGINFGAPGRRVDVNGSGMIWHDRPGTRRRHASAIKDANGSLPWALASNLEADNEEPIRIDDVAEGTYKIRLHFAELEPDVGEGERSFSVFANGQEVIGNLDVAAAAGGAFRGLIREFTVEASRRIDIELRQSNGSARKPIINGLELVLQ